MALKTAETEHYLNRNFGAPEPADWDKLVSLEE